MTFLHRRLLSKLFFALLFVAAASGFALYFWPQISFLAGKLCWSVNLKKPAESLIMWSIGKKPTQEGFALLAKIQVELGDYESARWTLKQWIQQFPQVAERRNVELARLYIQMGKQALGKRDWPSIQQFYKKAIQFGAAQEVSEQLGKAAKASAVEAIKKGAFKDFLRLAELAKKLGIKGTADYKQTARQIFYNFLKKKKLEKAQETVDLLRWLKEDESTVTSLSWQLGFEMGKQGVIQDKTNWIYDGWHLMLSSSPPNLNPDLLFSNVVFPSSGQAADYVLTHAQLLYKSKNRVQAMRPLNPYQVILIAGNKVWLLDRLKGKSQVIFTKVEDFAFLDNGLFVLVLSLEPKGLGEAAGSFTLYRYDFKSGRKQMLSRTTGRSLYICGRSLICVTTSSGTDVFYGREAKTVVLTQKGKVFFLSQGTLTVQQEKEKLVVLNRFHQPLFQAGRGSQCSLFSSRHLICQDSHRRYFLVGSEGSFKLPVKGELALTRILHLALPCCFKARSPADFIQSWKEGKLISLPEAPFQDLPSKKVYLLNRDTYAAVRQTTISFNGQKLTYYVPWVKEGGKSFVHVASFFPLAFPALVSEKGLLLFFVLQGKKSDQLFMTPVKPEKPLTPASSEQVAGSIRPIYALLDALLPSKKNRKSRLQSFFQAVGELYGNKKRLS